MKYRFRLPALLLVLSLAAFTAGCGDDGSDGAEEGGSEATADGGVSSEEGGSSDGGSDSGDDGGLHDETGAGFVQVGDTRWDVNVVSCVSMAGAIGGRGIGVDDPENVDVSFDFAPEDWQDRPASEGWTATGSVRLDSEEPYLQWETGESVQDYVLEGIDVAQLDITSVDISDDAKSVSGEARFIELSAAMNPSAEAEPTPGSFEFHCP